MNRTNESKYVPLDNCPGDFFAGNVKYRELIINRPAY